MVELIVIEISTYKEGWFIALDPDGRRVKCYLQDKDRYWDMVYDYLTEPMSVKGSFMKDNSFLVSKICTY